MEDLLEVRDDHAQKDRRPNHDGHAAPSEAVAPDDRGVEPDLADADREPGDEEPRWLQPSLAYPTLLPHAASVSGRRVERVRSGSAHWPRRGPVEAVPTTKRAKVPLPFRCGAVLCL